jgi:hypothetical protein
MNEVKKTVTNKNWFIEKRLKTHFSRFPEILKCFIRIGDPSLFTSEVAVLTDTFGWQEKKSNTNISSTCLLIAISKCDTRDLDTTLKNCSETALILLYIGECKKTTPLYSKLEGFGFRMMFEWEGVAYFSKVTLKVINQSERKTLEDPEIRSILKQSWRRIRRLPDSTGADLISVHAADLLTTNRFDIAIKCLYGRLWKNGQAKVWRDYVYYEHLLRITGPGREIAEYDGTGKEGIDNFITGFHSLLSELDSQNIPTVPVDSNLLPFDGAHRIAAAIVMERSINVARIYGNSLSIANAEFFEKKSDGHSPCPEAILDEAAIEYCRVKQGVAIVLIFPTVNSENYAIDHLSNIGNLAYRKDINFTPEMGTALLRQVYLGQSWLEENSESSGFLHKVNSCFPYPGKLRVILLDEINPRKLRPTKELIRAHYGVGNHSIHITDGDDETLRAARVVFNEKSIDLLRAGIGVFPGFHEKLFLYRSWLEEHGLDEERFFVGGSALLSLFGLRECQDLDFLYHGSSESLPATPEKIDSHNKIENYYGKSIADIVGDPRLHCWYMGVKFCVPSLIRDMKRLRNESKDQLDVILLKSKIKNKRFFWFNKPRLKALRVLWYIRSKLAAKKVSIKIRVRAMFNSIRKK